MSNSYVGNRKTMSDLLYQSTFMLQIEEMRLQAERAEHAKKLLQDNLEMDKEVSSEITQDIYYTENLGYDIIPPADNGSEKDTDSEGMEYYENYVQDDCTFEEINPMSEISNTRNSIIFSASSRTKLSHTTPPTSMLTRLGLSVNEARKACGVHTPKNKRDCSIQTDNNLGEVAETLSVTLAKPFNIENAAIPLKKMESEIEELKKKITDVQSITSSEQHRLENTLAKFSNNVVTNNVNFMFKRFPRQKMNRPLTV